TQATAFIAAGHCTLAEYPAQFALHQLSLGQWVTAETSDQTVLSTFLLSMARMEREYPQAMAMLTVAAFLAPERIPSTLLQASIHTKPDEKTGTSAPSAQVIQAYALRILTALRRYALLQTADAFVNIHRLVQQLIRQRLTPRQHADAIRRT